MALLEHDEVMLKQIYGEHIPEKVLAVYDEARFMYGRLGGGGSPFSPQTLVMLSVLSGVPHWVEGEEVAPAVEAPPEKEIAPDDFIPGSEPASEPEVQPAKPVDWNKVVMGTLVLVTNDSGKTVGGSYVGPSLESDNLRVNLDGDKAAYREIPTKFVALKG